MPAGFRETTVFSGLTLPTAIAFSPDGRVFVGEKSGRILVFSGLEDRTPSLYADLGANVHNFWDRGLMTLSLDPDFPASPYVYVLYTYDADIGGTPPKWGDDCPTPPGPEEDGCVVSGRLSRLDDGGTEQVLVEGWCQQFPSHSLGDIQFDADGALYASGGEGASFNGVDYGQYGDPPNPCGDPNREGGAVRSQDLLTRSDPTGLSGSIIRVDRATGAPWLGNPNSFDPEPNAARILAYGMRNPFRFVFRPGTSELWIGDVGWSSADELNRLSVGGPALTNFGWPCYEGHVRQPSYDSLDLGICEGLYGSPGATRGPEYSYAWNDHIVPNDAGCYFGGAALAGLEFYEGGAYPNHEGTLFVADYARRCLWTAPPGQDGAPDLAQRSIFATGLAFPVDLEVGPGGDLYYVDFDGGSVRRIRYASANQPPTAVASADPTAGAEPLFVTFDGTNSFDPDEGDPLTYAWDFQDDGTVDSTEPTPTHTYAARGTYTARLRITDSLGEWAEATVLISVDNLPPNVSIDIPDLGDRWRVGDLIQFEGSAMDPEQGLLPPSAFTWRISLHHCQTGGLGCHAHVIDTVEDVSSGELTAPDHGYPAYLEFEVTVTDEEGLTDHDSVQVNPETVDLAFDTDPSGLVVLVGSEQSATPFSRTVIIGSRNSVSGPSPQTDSGGDWLFSSWSDGGDRSHDVVAPTDPTLYTARFMRPAQPPAPPPPPAPPASPPPPSPQPPAPPKANPKPKQVACVVPRLAGRTLFGARRALLSARCGLGHVKRVYSSSPKGRIRSQNPRAGRRLPNLAKVAVVVSRGRKR